jgi:large subunit ribosomal protein L10
VDRSQKEKLVAELHQTFGEVNLVVVTHQSGLTVAEVTELRRRMRAAGAGYKVSKNRLTRLALEGTKFAALQSLLTGPTAIATSDDPVAAAKICVEFAKDNEKMVIVGGALGEKALDVAGVTELAKLPSLDELRGRLIGLLQAPAGQLARVFSAYASQGEAA